MLIAILILFLAVMPGSAAYGQGLSVSATREIHGQSIESHHVESTEQGEVIAGTLAASGAYGKVEVFNAVGHKLRSYEFRNGTISVGVVPPAPGIYRITVTATSIETAGSYVLNVRRQSQADRMSGHHVHPRQDYASRRIAQLKSDLERGVAGAEELFWAEVAETGAPLVEPIPGDDHDVLMTFVWKQNHKTYNVLLQWPPAYNDANDYYMSHLAGTSLWHKTIRVRQGARFAYAFSPNDLPDERDVTTHHDPLNRRRSSGADDSFSLVELPGAPDDRWATEIPRRRGIVLQKTFESTLLKGRRDIWIYTPPDYASGGNPHPLVILFNPPMYIGSGVAPTVLDNLAAQGRIRPPIVCIIQSDPLGQLLTSRFADAVATELVPQLRSTHRISTDTKDVVIGGFSANAVWAAYIALKHSDIFGNVLSQSGAFRFRLPGELEPNSLSSIFANAPRAPVRFYLDSGLYEPFPAASRPADESALDESNTTGNRHFRDVLRAKGYDVTYRETGGGHEQSHWRATLGEALTALLPLR